MAKTTYSCPNCSRQVKLPAGKKVKYSCPTCGAENIFDDTASKPPRLMTTKNVVVFCLVSLVISIGGKKYKRYRYINKIEKTIQTAVDIKEPTTNDAAVRLAARFPGKFNIRQVCRIHRYLTSKWKYVNDPQGMENIRPASRTILNNYAGDCDDFAIVISAMIESIGGTTRVSFAHGRDGRGHAFTEVLAGNTRAEAAKVSRSLKTIKWWQRNYEPRYTVDKMGRYWLNLDWWGEPRRPGNEYYNYRKRYIVYPRLDVETEVERR